MNGLQSDKDKAVMLFQQGWAADCQGDFIRAEESYRQGFNLDVQNFHLCNVLTLLLSRLGKMAEIDQLWSRCEAALPEAWDPRLYRTLDLLKAAHFDQGFQRREQLFDNRDFHRSPTAPPVNYPRWQGEDLQGRSIVIWTEFGFGDELMMCRFVSVLKQLGAARVSIVCQKAIVPVVASLRDADLVLADSDVDQLPDHDYWIYPFAIPVFYSLQTHGIPAQIPYLFAETQKVTYWQHFLPDNPGQLLKIGLVWRGNPSHENDHLRSIDHLALLAPILQLPGIQWVSLQKGSAETQWQECTAPATQSLLTTSAVNKIPLAFAPIVLGNQVEDFADTAAIIESLDLVITVDTAVAHLAGAMGKPVWVLLPIYVDWRWQAGRVDSPWYPTMCLFRQKIYMNWSEPVAMMQEALQRHLREKRGTPGEHNYKK
ncbi:MAG: glycosyltransferase family 9 protein [Enterobacteriaceae bacterium]